VLQLGDDGVDRTLIANGAKSPHGVKLRLHVVSARERSAPARPGDHRRGQGSGPASAGHQAPLQLPLEGVQGQRDKLLPATLVGDIQRQEPGQLVRGEAPLLSGACPDLLEELEGGFPVEGEGAPKKVTMRPTSRRKVAGSTPPERGGETSGEGQPSAGFGFQGRRVP